MSDQHTEFTLGIGKLLAMFLGLVVLCAVFFVMGYTMGKNNAPVNATLTAAPSGVAVPAAMAQKPAALQVAVSKPDCAQTVQGCGTTTAVAPDDAAAAAQPTSAAVPANTAAAPVVIDGSRPARQSAPEPSRQSRPPSPTLTPAAAVVPPGTYTVQVAAVSKQQDAEALVAALRRKQYQVFIATQVADTLYHVQIGPFADAKQADSVRSRLMADGYTPIVKR